MKGEANSPMGAEPPSIARGSSEADAELDFTGLSKACVRAGKYLLLTA